MYELSHILLLLWGGQVGVVGSQGVEDSPAVAAQFLAILRAILPKLAVPLWKEADQGSVRFSQTRNLQSSLFFFRPSRRPTDRRQKSWGRSSPHMAKSRKAGPTLGARLGSADPRGGGGQPVPGARGQGVGAPLRLHLLLRAHPRLDENYKTTDPRNSMSSNEAS